MLRTLGIPSRIVNGFRGGEYNDLTSSYIVREKDAHSWVEVYFPEYGWVSFDPTPAGSADEPQTGWSRVGLYLDAARQIWREWIVNYDFTHQMKLRSDLSTATGNAQSNFRTWAERQYFRVVELISRWQRRLEALSPRADGALLCVARFASGHAVCAHDVAHYPAHARPQASAKSSAHFRQLLVSAHAQDDGPAWRA